MTEAPKYEIKTTHASIGAKKIQLTNRTPVFSEEDRKKTQQGIEHALFHIFEKYL